MVCPVFTAVQGLVQGIYHHHQILGLRPAALYCLRVARGDVVIMRTRIMRARVRAQRARAYVLVYLF